MDLLVCSEQHFARDSRGTVWTTTAYGRTFWSRYLEVFDRVRVVARVARVSEVPVDWIQASDHRVSFHDVPDYTGPGAYLRRWFEVERVVKTAIGADDAVILRVSSQIGTRIAAALRRLRHPYAVEVVCSPHDVFAPGAVRHSARPIFRWLFDRGLRRQCLEAAAASYVTRQALQTKYPPRRDAYTTHYSRVELPESAFVTCPRICDRERSTITIVCVGSFAQHYKGQDLLVRALKSCLSHGLDLRLVLVGDGRFRRDVERLAVHLGVEQRVVFTGELPAGKPVCDELDQADLFVLPSRTEGLPRAMLEAMARGLPCLGSAVGGIPELLDPEALVRPGDEDSLARKIREVVTDPGRLARMSERNLNASREYSDEVLRKRRHDFYAVVRSFAERWSRERRQGESRRHFR